MSNVFLDHEFESRGIWNGPDALKTYCPPAKVRMRFEKFDNPDAAAGSKRAYYKAVITLDQPGNAAGPMIEKVVYLEDGPDRLVGTNIEGTGRMLLDEVIVIDRDPVSKAVTGLDHRLSFWPGVVASWPCGIR